MEIVYFLIFFVEKKRSVKLKSLRDLKNDDEETEDEQECKVQ